MNIKFNKKLKDLAVQLITYSLVVVYILNSSSCANTKTGPSGGPKDTLAPVVLEIFPDSNALNVPTTDLKVTITFDEYVQIKEASKNILLSPPQKTKPNTKIKGKSIVVTLEEELDSTKTYSLNFGSAIADNNEGNIFENFVYSFSTGSTIDSMLISGTVLDNSTLFPYEGATVAIYANPTDSSVINILPDAVTRSDKWGYFTLRNLKPIPYKIYAFKDENGNNLYDAGSEQIGFLDSMVTPTIVMKNGLPQLSSYDMKDTINSLSRPVELSINVFNERPTVQYISSYERPTKRGAYIKFNAPDVIIDSFSIKGIREDLIIKQFNNTNDSLSFWINKGGVLADTLLLGIKYHKTDSLGNLIPSVENLKLIAPVEISARAKAKAKKDAGNKNKEREDLLKFNMIAAADMVEQTGYILEFSEPILKFIKDSITLTSSTPKKVVTDEEFTLEVDSLNINRYVIKPNQPFVLGNDYQLRIPTATFTDINGFTNDSLLTNVTLPNDDKLSSLTLDITGVESRYVVELVTTKRDKVFRTYVITEDTKLLFPYLKAGEYSLRIFEDRNNNSIIDPGVVLKDIQPEKVLLYKLPDDKEIIEIKERTDIEQSVDLSTLF